MKKWQFVYYFSPQWAYVKYSSVIITQKGLYQIFSNLSYSNEWIGWWWNQLKHQLEQTFSPVACSGHPWCMILVFMIKFKIKDFDNELDVKVLFQPFVNVAHSQNLIISFLPRFKLVFLIFLFLDASYHSKVYYLMPDQNFTMLNSVFWKIWFFYPYNAVQKSKLRLWRYIEGEAQFIIYSIFSLSGL